ncbi:MAG: reverse transcriptase domain-containing protein [Bacteroidota bacterium]
MVKTFFPEAGPIQHERYTSDRAIQQHKLTGLFTEWINEAAVLQAFQKFKPKKSPGPDGLPPRTLMHLPPNILRILILIYKGCIYLHYTPLDWRGARVIFLPKPGKASYRVPKSFRPIALSNYMLKALERLVVWRMEEKLQENPLHPNQHGFLSDKGTESAISSTVNRIEGQIHKGKKCLGVFLDISSAFNTITPKHVKETLYSHGGEKHLVRWYYHYMKSRRIHINLHGAEESYQIDTGFPQGGVASAKFWLIAFDEAIRIANKYGIVGNGFADDIGAVICGRTVKSMVNKMQRMIDELTDWGRGCGLKFCPQKSVAVLFGRKKMPNNPPKVHIYGEPIEYQTSVKYLGVTLDQKLDWKQHIKGQTDKAKSLLLNINNTVRDNWGPKPKLMKWAYAALVRPVLTYASMNWGHAIIYQNQIDSLRRINRMAANAITNIPRSTPTRMLEISLDLPPIPLVVTRLALNTYIRLHKVLPDVGGINPNRTKYTTPHLSYWKEILTQSNIPVEDRETCLYKPQGLAFKVTLASFDDSAKSRTPSQLNIYTDGSKDDNATGCGFLILTHNGHIITQQADRLSNVATVFQAELRAIQKGAQFIIDNPGLHGKHVKLFSDSQAAILAVNQFIVRDTQIKDTIDTLHTAGELCLSLRVGWIKAHAGHLGNERADSLAKSGLSLPHVTLGDIPYPLSYFKQLTLEYIHNQWNTEWREYQAARQSKFFYPTVNTSKSREILLFGRFKLGTFLRIISGHNGLSYFRHLVDAENNDPFCRFCDSHRFETSIHLLSECDFFALWRREIFLDNEPGPNWVWDPGKILDFMGHPDILAVLGGYYDGNYFLRQANPDMNLSLDTDISSSSD